MKPGAGDHEQMSATGRPTRAVLALCFLACTTGCGLLRPVPPPMPAADVAARLRESTGAVNAFSCSVRVRISQEVAGDGSSLPSLGGTLAFDVSSPGLFWRATKVMQEVFTLRARGDRFSLAIPSTREVGTGGPRAYARLPHLLRPQEVRAIFDGPDALGLTWPDTRMSVERRHYVFEARVLGVPYRRVLVDRRDLVITSIQRFDSLGRITSEVLLDDYEEVDGALLPTALTVRRERVVSEPPVSITVRMSLADLKLLPKGVPESFITPQTPPGYRVINLDYEPLESFSWLSDE